MQGHEGSQRADDANLSVDVKEVQLVKKAFLDEDQVLLKVVRALFLGLGCTASEKALIRTHFADPQLRAVMWNRFCPQMDKTAPIGSLSDVYLGVEQMVFGFSRDTVYQAVYYKKAAVEMTKQALMLLENPDGPAPDLTIKFSEVDALQVGLLARNMFIRHVEKQLGFLWMIANQKTETPKEAEKRRVKDSTR